MDGDIFLDSPTPSEQKAAEEDSPPSIILRPQSNDSTGPNNFLNDSKMDMTFSRRIALVLMRYEWYNPSKRTETTTESSEEEVSLSLPSLEKAWAYFEHYTLRRFITTSNNKMEETVVGKLKHIFNLEGANDLKMADPGEENFQTKLYNPISTPLTQMSGFGSDIILYFFTLKTMAFLTFVAGLISIPNILYFSGDTYSSGGQNGLNFFLQGSAACKSFEWVPCPECSLDDYREEERYRFHMEILTNGEVLTFALKNKCNGATLTTGFVSFCTFLFILFSTIWIHWYLKNLESSLDESVGTAKDYSIHILNPPVDAIDPKEWRDFFMDNFEDLHVRCCTVGVANKGLITKLLKRRECQEDLRKKLFMKNLPNKTELVQISRDHILKRTKFGNLCAIFSPGVPEIFKRIRNLDIDIQRECTNERAARNVFVTFETKRSQRDVLNVFNVAPYSVRTNEKDALSESKFLFRNELVLHVKEADDPSTLRWYDIDEAVSVPIRTLIFPMSCTIFLIVISSLFVSYIRKEEQSSTYAAIAVSLLNAFMPHVAIFLTNMECHKSEKGKQTSLYVKIAAFRWINSAVVLGLVTVSESPL